MKRATFGLLAVLLLGSCSEQSPGEGRAGGPEDRSGGAWSRMTASPLSARYASQTTTIGGKLYVIGGTAAEPCPPNADCIEPRDPFYRDGASYDPVTGTWSDIADALIPVGHGSSAVVDGILYLLANDYGSTHPSVRPAFLSYDPSRDRWEELVLPRGHRERILTSAGSEVVAFQQSQENGVEGDLIYDPGSGKWSQLPPDPLRESFDRWMVWTDEGLVLLGIENVPQPGAEKPAVYRAALLVDGDRWERFDDSEIIGYNPEWSWTGGKVLNASNESADGGGTNNWGRTYHAGGTLDPATGQWELLEDPPPGRGELTGINDAGDRYSVAYSGWVYDARDERWLHLTRPRGGPEAEMSTAWLDDELYVWGGVDWQGSEGVILDAGWVWHPED